MADIWRCVECNAANIGVGACHACGPVAPPPAKPQPALSAETLGEEDRAVARLIEAANGVAWMLSAFNAGHAGSPGQHERSINEFQNALHCANATFDRLLKQGEG